MATKTRYKPQIEALAEARKVRGDIVELGERIADMERQIKNAGPSREGTYWLTSRVRELESMRRTLVRLVDREARLKLEASSE